MAKIGVGLKLEQLGISLKSLSEDTVKKCHAATLDLAQKSYHYAMKLSDTRLHTTRQQYLNALHFEPGEGENVAVLFLDDEAAHLEDGYSPFDMKPGILRSPKAKISKDGHKYMVIPLRQTTENIANKAHEGQDLAAKLRSIVDDRKFKTVKQGVSPVTGKMTKVEKYTGPDIHPHLKGLVRVREYKNASGKGGPASSSYMTFRVISEKSKPESWRHPGYRGANIMKDTESWARSQIDLIVKDIFGV